MNLKKKASLTSLLVCVWAVSTCGREGRVSSALVPENNEVASWKMVGAPVVLQTEADLYNRIDGGAPKYLERGWVSCVYAEYRKEATGASLLTVVHDMGTPAGAETIFKTALPAMRTEISYTTDRETGDQVANAVVDLHLSGTYAAYGFSNRYYIELNTDAKTDAALDDVKAFMLRTLEKNR
jgi:hypothetical protein